MKNTLYKTFNIVKLKIIFRYCELNNTAQIKKEPIAREIMWPKCGRLSPDREVFQFKTMTSYTYFALYFKIVQVSNLILYLFLK